MGSAEERMGLRTLVGRRMDSKRRGWKRSHREGRHQEQRLRRNNHLVGRVRSQVRCIDEHGQEACWAAKCSQWVCGLDDQVAY